MPIEDIYRDTLLKYPLTIKEFFKLDKVWEFAQIFQKPYIFITDYRNYIIKEIQKKYTLNEFYEYEAILNKLFWNLRWLLFPLWYKPNMDNDEYWNFIEEKPYYGDFYQIPESLLLCSCAHYSDIQDLKKKVKESKLFEGTYYRSFINKLILIDQETKVIYTKPIEGSSDIFAKNYFNLMSMTILFNRDLYEKIIQNPYGAKDMKLEYSNYYYQYDYAYPNLNYCVYSFGTQEQRRDRINKMYYVENSARWWFKIII